MRRTPNAQPIEPTETVAVASLLACPVCEMSYRAEIEHVCDPERLWRQHVASWNALPVAEQQSARAECQESGHDFVDIPLAATRMCTRCCVYVAVEKGN